MLAISGYFTDISQIFSESSPFWSSHGWCTPERRGVLFNAHPSVAASRHAHRGMVPSIGWGYRFSFASGTTRILQGSSAKDHGDANAAMYNEWYLILPCFSAIYPGCLWLYIWIDPFPQTCQLPPLRGPLLFDRSTVTRQIMTGPLRVNDIITHGDSTPKTKVHDGLVSQQESDWF